MHPDKVHINTSRNNTCWELNDCDKIRGWPEISENSSALKLGSLSVLWLTKQNMAGQWTIRELLAWRKRLSRNLGATSNISCEEQRWNSWEKPTGCIFALLAVLHVWLCFLCISLYDGYTVCVCQCVDIYIWIHLFEMDTEDKPIHHAPVCVDGGNGLPSVGVQWLCLLQQDALHQPGDIYADVAGEAVQGGCIDSYPCQEVCGTGYLLGGLVVISHSHDDPGETVFNRRHLSPC